MTPQPAWLSQKRRRADSNRCSGRDAQSRTERSWHSGFWLFLAIVALAAAPLVDRTLGQVAVGVLFALWLLTLFSVKQAAADRSSEAVQANKGKVTSDSP